MMKGSRGFVFGESYAVYSGPAGHTSLHQHAAYQFVLGVSSELVVFNDSGSEMRGHVFLIPPLLKHTIRCSGVTTVIFIDAHSAIIEKIKTISEATSIVDLSKAELPFSRYSKISEIINILHKYSQTESSNIDPRLAEAIAKLGERPGEMKIANVAEACGLSISHLRTLARQELGVPISTWLIWRKLEKASRALAEGTSLAESALIGGFTDQAHFSRTMRRMIGMTPQEALAVLK